MFIGPSPNFIEETEFALDCHEALPVLSSQRLPDVVNMEDFSRKDLESADSSSSSGQVEQLSAENEALRGQVRALEEQAASGRAEPDGGPSRDSLLRENEELHGEVERLKTLSKSAAKVNGLRMSWDTVNCKSFVLHTD